LSAGSGDFPVARLSPTFYYNRFPNAAGCVTKQCIHKLSVRGSAAFRPLQREGANEFGGFSQSRGTSDIEAP